MEYMGSGAFKNGVRYLSTASSLMYGQTVALINVIVNRRKVTQFALLLFHILYNKIKKKIIMLIMFTCQCQNLIRGKLSEEDR